MTRFRRSPISAALLLALALGCAPAGAAGSAALVNPGFDMPADDRGRPPGWTMEAAARDKGTVELIEGQRGAGGRLLRLRPNGSNTGDKLLGFGQLLDARAYRGRPLAIRVSMGASGGATAIVGVHLLGKGGDLGFVQVRQPDSGGELKLQARSLDVPQSAETIVVYVTTPSTAGAAVFDTVDLGAAAATPTADPARASGSAPPPPLVAAAPGPTGPVSITVDPKRVLRRIPPTIYGTNAEWIFEGQGLWSPQRRTLDPGALARVQEMAPTVIRFPGGVFSDIYHWKDGIGAQDKRPSTPNFPKGPVSRHSLGTQEIAEVARRAGAELMFTVNAGTGNAEEAAGWVAYARQNVKPAVRLWEVGNELYMKDDLSGGSMSARQYTKKFLEYAAAMRAADPDIRVGAIGGLNYGSYRFMSDDRWSETLLKGAAPQIDFLAVHNAYAPVVIGVSPQTDPKSVYRAMLAAPRQIEANLQDLSKLLDRYESPSRRISLAVTEWGPSFHASPQSPWVDHVKTMGSALFVASTLNAFLRTPRLEVANFFKLTDYAFMGWIGRRGEDWTTTAPGLAFGLYRHALGRTLVSTDVASPTFDTPGLGAVAAIDKAPWVDAVATYDQGALVVVVVNRSDTQSFDGSIVLKGVKGFGEVTAEGLSADSLDSNTGTELPKIPGLEWARQVEVSRLSRGGAGEIRKQAETLPQTAAGSAADGPADPKLRYRLKPLSITALRFARVETR